MSESASVSVWIEQLQNGNAEAAQKVWERYYQRLVGLAQHKLRRRGGVVDGDDIAQSAFNSFFQGVKNGRFPRLDDRDDLWQILFMITERKAFDLIQWERRDKRDARRTGGEIPPELAGNEPDPAFAVEVAEQCEMLLAKLPKDRLREVARRKMEGYTNEEIAAKLDDCAVATVERCLRDIRLEWAHLAKTGGKFPGK